MDNNQINISFGTTDDIQAIAQFQVDMAMESEGTTLDKSIVIRGVTHAMEDDSKGRYVVAHADGKAIGSLLLTKELATRWWGKDAWNYMKDLLLWGLK